MTTQEVYALPLGALLRAPDGTFMLLLNRVYPEVIEDIGHLWCVPEYEVQLLGTQRRLLEVRRGVLTELRFLTEEFIINFYQEDMEDAKRIA
jgi:hypothetical protein